MKCNHTAVRFDWGKKKNHLFRWHSRSNRFDFVLFGTPGWIRTSGLQSRSLSRYPTALRAHKFAVFLTTKAIIPHPFGNCKSFLHFFWIHFLTAKTEAGKHNKTIPAFGLLAKSGKKCYTEKIELSHFGGEEPCYVQAVPHDAAIYENQRSA